MQKELEQIFDFFLFLEKLSINKRWGSTNIFIKKESIADHSFRVLLIVFVMYRKLKPNIDLLKTLKIVLVHDIIEGVEAQIVKALDKFEGISHLLYYGYENFDEPDIIATHCDTHFKKVPELLPLLKILKTRLKEEYEKWGKDWKREYDEVFL